MPCLEIKTLIILRLETFPNLINKVDAIPIGFSKKIKLKT